MSVDWEFRKPLADRAINFYPRYLKHIEGPLAGQPFELAPFQKQRIIGPVFGTVHPDTGLRRYRTVFIFLPRKNGKSSLAAGIGVQLVFIDGERRAQVYACATDFAQAGYVFEPARLMVQGSRKLRQRSRVLSRSIVVKADGSFFKAISAQPKHGANVHAAIVDELHQHKGDFQGSLLEAMVTGRGARLQPLVVMITTAGFDRNSICGAEYEYACKVRDGVFEDDTYLPVIFEAPEDTDPADPATWALANPNLGTSVQLDFLESEWKRAQQSPAQLNSFRRLYLNQWTEQETKWIPRDAWAACAEPDWPADADLRDVDCGAGLDLSSREDVSSLVLAWRLRGRVFLRAWHWIPEYTATRRSLEDRVPYDKWAADGHMTLTPGRTVDYNFIEAKLLELGEQFRIVELAYDPWQAMDLANRLEQGGLDLVEHRQGWGSMAGPVAEFQRLWISGELAHQGDPVMTWMADNVAVREDPAGNLKPDKGRSGDRIDGIVAAIMAVGRVAAGVQSWTADDVIPR